MDHSDANIAPAAQPKIELTINTKPSEAIKAEHKETICTCKNTKTDDANDGFVAAEDDDIPIRDSRPRDRVTARRYSPSPSPIRIRGRYRPPIRDEPLSILKSSSDLLEKVGNFDGVADLPFPGRSSVYLTTYPFTARDVKKWGWLLGHGVQEVWATEGRARSAIQFVADENTGYPIVQEAIVQEAIRRSRSPYYDSFNTSMPNIYLSRALDTTVVPDDTEGVKYMIIVQDKQFNQQAKLIVVESRKAAGIVIYLEALSMNSVVFVGATTTEMEKGARMRVRKVKNLEEAAELEKEGILGIVC